MKVIVSACLLGNNCKYNGGNNRCQKVLDFVKDHEIIPVCPEQMGGLSTPRLPAEICNGKVVNTEGVSVDTEFRKEQQPPWRSLWRKVRHMPFFNQEAGVVDASRFTMARSARHSSQAKESLHNYWQIMVSYCWNQKTYKLQESC